jgi:hypothetical protein
MSEFIVEGYNSDASNSTSVEVSYFGGAKSDKSDSDNETPVLNNDDSDSSSLYNSDCSSSEDCDDLPFDGSFSESDDDLETDLGNSYIGLSDFGDIKDEINKKDVKISGGGAKHKEKIHDAVLHLTDLGDIQEMKGGRGNNISEGLNTPNNEESPFVVMDAPAYVKSDDDDENNPYIETTNNDDENTDENDENNNPYIETTNNNDENTDENEEKNTDENDEKNNTDENNPYIENPYIETNQNYLNNPDSEPESYIEDNNNDETENDEPKITGGSDSAELSGALAEFLSKVKEIE